MRSVRAAAALLALCTLVGASFTVARAPFAFTFPRDHGAHPQYQSEWWYYTGHLRDPSGRWFGYELTFFRLALSPRAEARRPAQSDWRGTQIYPAHFAITDETGKRFVYYERTEREAMRAGGAAQGRLDVWSGDWTLREDASGMHLHASRGGDALSLTLRSRKPPAIHGHGGVSRKGPCNSCASHYYSMTRMATAGTLTYGGVRREVTGFSWMDHEFGSDELQSSQAGWDWFALQLDDGREVMLYRLRQKDGSVTPQSSGSVIDRGGRVTYVTLSAFTIDALGTWKSPRSGAVYPSGWHVRVARAHIDVLLTPAVADQELAANDQNGISYWEGSVIVADAASGRQLGRAYVELTGYAAPISL